jgi:lipoyl(octanoyl) transferase
MEKNCLEVLTPGILGYADGLSLQYELVAKRKDNKINDTLILLEHSPVITAGKRGKESDILITPEEAERLGVEIHVTERGGEITYHGPGQIVGYLIFALRRQARKIKKFVYTIEEVFISLLEKNFNIAARHDYEHTGVWVGDKKIAAIGIAIKEGITMHGFAFNVNTDLSHFEWIVPCGIQGKGITSLEQLTGATQNMQDVQEMIVSEFRSLFEYS